jgi:hypothetical protein
MASQYEDIFPSTDENLLYALLRTSSLRKPKTFDVVTITSNSSTFSLLPLPTDAQSAWLVLETDGTEANPAKACRFKLTGDGDPPTSTEGMPLGDGGNLRLENLDQLEGFRIIGVDGGTLAHKLSVQFFD